MGDAEVKSSSAQAAFGLMGGVPAKIMPQTKRDGGQFQTRVASLTERHCFISVFCGDIGHIADFLVACRDQHQTLMSHVWPGHFLVVSRLPLNKGVRVSAC